jgi:hypothetical protein
MSTRKPKLGEAAQVLLGFRIQELRFLLRLLQSKDGDKVWIEYYDDVGVTREDGSSIIEQDTTSQDGNPLSNRAEKIWKTFANWVRGAKAGWFDADKSDFVLYIPQSAKPGSVVQSLIDAKDAVSAGACVADVEEFFWGKPPSFAKKSGVSDTLSDHIETVLADKTIFSKVIQRFSVVSSDDEGVVTTLLSAFDSLFGFPKGERRRIHFCKFAIGHLLLETTPTLEADKLICLEWSAFNEFARDYYSHHVRSDYLSSIASPPTEDEVDAVLTSCPTFVRQLQIIDWPENDILQQINSYLMTAEDVVGWGADSEISKYQFAQFETQLTSYWSGQRISLLHDGLAANQFGCKLAAKCLTQNFEIVGKKVDYHITPGTYHHLADGGGKKVKIGWHPEYDTIFNKGGDNQ